MLVFIIIVLAAAGTTYLVAKNKTRLSSVENSIKSTIEKVEAVATPIIEEVEEIVAKAAKATPKNRVIATAVKDIKKVKTTAKKVTSNK
jgi:hypothetical protein